MNRQSISSRWRPKAVGAAAALLSLATVAAAGPAKSGDPGELFDLVVMGASCRQVGSTGTAFWCDYSIGDKLKLIVRQESTGVSNIGFKHSDMQDDLYAVMYDGCVAVVPGAGHPRNYDSRYVAYISPVNGRVYKELGDCKSAGK